MAELSSYLHRHEGELPAEVRERIDINPLRAFDSKHEGTRALMAEAPKIVERLEGEDAQHFAEVRALLDAAGIPYEIDPTLVRGLDYYSRTIFSFTCDRLGAQSEIGGGGRYDGLIEQLGGKPTPAIGWAAGIERIVLALEGGEWAPERDVFIAFDAEQQQLRSRAMLVARDLRKAGLSAEIDLGARSMKGQLKCADRVGARYALILAADGAQLRDMSSGQQRSVETGDLIEEIARGVS
jgi:histidyl-tRNA synthetase